MWTSGCSGDNSSLLGRVKEVSGQAEPARWKQQNLLFGAATWTEKSEPMSMHSKCKYHREADMEKSFSGGNRVH